MLNYLQPILIFVLSLTSASVVWAQCACDEIEVKFRGYNCAANGGFTISLNGESANGSGDDCGAYFETTWATTKLVAKTTYTLSSSNSCSHHVDLDIPECFDLYVDGVLTEGTALDASSSGESGGDERWSIELRLKTESSGSPGGSGGAPESGSFFWEASMGTLLNGTTAGNVFIYGESVDGSFYSPSSLQLSANASIISTVYGADGTTYRQLVSEEVVADIVTLDAYGYEIRFYELAQSVTADQLVSVGGTPRVIWRIENPDRSDTIQDRLEITEIRGGTSTSHMISSDPSTNETLISCYGGAYSVATREEVDPVTGNRIVTETTRDGANAAVLVVKDTFHEFDWGEELIENSVNSIGVDEVTTYVYNEGDPTAGGYSRLHSVSYPSGAWERFQYNDSGRVSRIYKPWLNLPATADEANDSNSFVTINSYRSGSNGLFLTELAGVEERILGEIVSKVAYNRRSYSLGGEPVEEYVIDRYMSSGKYLREIRVSYRSTASEHLKNRLLSTQSSSGVVWNYVYEEGIWDSNTLTFTSGTGDAIRTIATQGTNANPDGVASKSLREIEVENESGRRVYALSSVFDGTSYVNTTENVYVYNLYGNLLERYKDGRLIIENTYVNGIRKSTIDETGVETTFTHYSDGQLHTETKVGVDGEPDLVTTYSYDCLGFLESYVRSADSLSESESYTYYGDGRSRSATDMIGATVEYSYTPGDLIYTEMMPGGVTVVHENFLDGQIKSITGSGVINEYYSYGVDENGSRFTQVNYVSEGSPRWKKVYANWIGQVVKEEQPAYDGSIYIKEIVYDSYGQRVKEVKTGYNPNLYVYDEFGNLRMSGIDMDGDGILAPASKDRISLYDNYYSIVGNTVEEVYRESVFRKDDVGVPELLSETRKLLSGYPDGVASRVVRLKANGVQVTTVKEIDRSSKSYTVRKVSSELGRTIEELYKNGLLRSANSAKVFQFTNYVYDGLERELEIDEPLIGVSKYFYNTEGLLQRVEDAVGKVIGIFTYYPNTHQNSGELMSETDGIDNLTYYVYNERGQLTHQWGVNVYPVQYEYNAYGERVKQRTYRTDPDVVDWSSVSWPTNSGPGDETEWGIQESTGLLTRKEYADSNGTDYTYDGANRLSQRDWARGVTTSYSYDSATGDLLSVNYSDATTDVFYSYNRQGQRISVEDASGTRNLDYTAYGETKSSQYLAGPLADYELTINHDQFGRFEGLDLSDAQSQSLVNYNINYDASSRVQSITWGDLSIEHVYHPSGDVLVERGYKKSGTRFFESRRHIDTLGRLQSVRYAKTNGTVVSHVGYEYDDLDRRVRASFKNGDYWAYSYNDRSEVIDLKRYMDGDLLQAGLQHKYSFDSIGNRLLVEQGGDSSGLNLRSSGYTPNQLNQYDVFTVPGYLQIVGQANELATVEVNSTTATRQGNYWHQELVADNTLGPVFSSVEVDGTRSGYTLLEENGFLFLQAGSVVPVYDLDGNLTSDGRWNYTWNGENRLISMETNPASVLAGVPRVKLEFDYDAQGRRFSKRVYEWNSAGGAWNKTEDILFVYAGWNLLAELDGSGVVPDLKFSYLWGHDLSGTFTDSGGIEGLLAVRSVEYDETWLPYYNGNGDVLGYLDADSEGIVCELEYDTFGQIIKLTGLRRDECKFRFSTKFTDLESGLYYYGFRYYSSKHGNWLSRDPIEEEGGLNLYGFVANNAISNIDPDGLAIETGWDLFNVGVGFVELGVCVATGNLAGAGWAAGGLAVDVAATLIPGVPGGASTLVKAKKLGKIADANKVSIVRSRTWHTAMKRHLDDLAGRGSLSGKEALRYIVRQGADQAHHILPKGGLPCAGRCKGELKRLQQRLRQLQKRAKDAGIDINNDISNLVSIDNQFHRRLHSNRGSSSTYVREVLDHFGDATSPSAIRSLMDDLADQLLRDSGKVL